MYLKLLQKIPIAFFALWMVCHFPATAQPNCTTHGFSNGAGSITFNVENTNSGDIIITGINSAMFGGTAGTFTFTLLYNTTPISSSGAIWSQGTVGVGQNGWQLAGTGTVTLPIHTTPQSVLTGLSILIPAGQTYGFGLSANGTIGYQTIPATVNLFSSGGVNLITGTNVSWGGGAYPATPLNYPRGWNGCIDWISAPPCSGPAIAGTASGPANVCPGANAMLNLTGYSSGTGTTFQWEKFNTTTLSWNPIGGANNPNYTTPPLTVATDYRCVVTCTNSSLTDISNIVSVGMSPFYNCYCTSAATFAANGEILNVTFGSMNNSSTCAASNQLYTDFTSTVTPPLVVQGAVVPFSLHAGSCGGNFKGGLKIYIDYNQNGIFDPSDQAYFQGKFTYSPTTIINNNITIPITALPGITRMRVIMMEGGTATSIVPCGTYGYGETEDYLVEIVAAVPCSGQPAHVTISGPSVVCPNVAFTLIASGQTIGAGITYQWERYDAANSMWNTIPNAINPSYTVTGGITTATDYRFVTTCTNSSSTDMSNTISVTINSAQCYCIPTYANGGGSDYISNVVLGTLSNNTAAQGNPAPYYRDYTTQQPGTIAIPDLMQGVIYPVALSFGPDGTQHHRVWIDFNQDGVFSATENFTGAPNPAGGNGTATVWITVPLTAVPGNTRMRIRGADDAAISVTQACGASNSTFGEAEDYLVNIVAATVVMPSTHILYVDSVATGANNGTSWADAYTSFAYAVMASHASLAVDTILVAKGIYLPQYPADGNSTWSRDKAFVFTRSNLAVLGGYPSGGTGVRNSTANPVILSGNIGNPNDTTDNVNHVVITVGTSVDSSLLFDGITVTRGSNWNYWNQDNITVNGITIEVGMGVGWYNNGGSPVLTNVTISGNMGYESYGGGGWYNANGNPVLTNVTISGNTGGGWYNQSGNPVFTNVTISGNRAAGEGGGWRNINGNPVLTNVTISGNTGHWIGGGWYNENGNPVLTNVIISGNTSHDNGGGWYNISGNPVLTGVTISGNTSHDNGGGWYNGNGNPVLTDVTISGNTGFDDGGGWLQGGGNPVLTNVIFSGNTSNNNGGGWCNNGGDPVLTNITISDNTTDDQGGGWCNNGGNPSLMDVTISGNTGGNNNGGGGWCNNGGNPVLTNVTISGNTGYYLGGGGWLQGGGNPVLTNVIISGNTTYDNGGGWLQYGGNPVLTNVTISGNRADGEGGGIFCSDTLFIRNSIVYGNTAPLYPGISGTISSSHSLIQDIPGGSNGNLNGTLFNPLFVNPEPAASAPATAGNYRLQVGSPCINAGDNAWLPLGVTTDPDGNPRIQNGTVDMGAYESGAAGITIWYLDADNDGWYIDTSSNNTSPGAGWTSILPTGSFGDCNDNDVTIHTPQQYYVDADSDGYGSMTTAMLCSSFAPAGFATNNTDCDDNNSLIHEEFAFFMDNDNDGFGTGALQLACAADANTPPPGFATNNTDCDDNNSLIHTEFAFFMDNDNDGFGTGTSQLACASDANTPPTGFAINNTDCDDNNSLIHEEFAFFMDNDNDGFGTGTPQLACASDANIPPSGYSLNDTDCNDADATVHTPQQYYVDADGDGFGSMATAMFCSSFAPAGYSTNNTDCNDNDDTEWQSASLYIDNDNDGYDNGTAIICYGAVVPAGYANTTLGDDCDDNNAGIHTQYPFYADNDGDTYGAGSSTMVCAADANTPPAGYSTNNADCDDSNPNINPGAQTFSFSAAPGFGNAFCSPLTGSPYTTFQFEVVYTDVNNSLPPAFYPRVLLDYEGNGVFNNANDRTVIMTEADVNDVTTSDGKKYIGFINSLPTGTSWQTSIMISQNSCITQTAAFHYPDVLIQPDLEIFANDISFSAANPAVSSPLTVSAVVNNNSDYPADNFVVHLVNQYDITIVYPDIMVSSLAPHASATVSWNITTPSVPAWCPMQVSIDYTDVITETNELNNSAIRPFINGNFNLPGGIHLSVSPAAPVAYTTQPYLGVYGNAYYFGTPVPLADPSAAGAMVTFTIIEIPGATYVTHTDAAGNFSYSFPSPQVAGVYHIEASVTDFTLTGTGAAYFTLIAPPPPPPPVNPPTACTLPDLVVSINTSPPANASGTITMVQGDTVSGSVTVVNNGPGSSINTTLGIYLSGSVPALSNVVVPPLLPNDSYTYYFNNLVFSLAGFYSFCVTSDADNDEQECNEYNNTACRGINVLPAQPDIYPNNGPSGQVYLCNAGNPGFALSNSGGVATGAFTCEVIIRQDGIPVDTLLHAVSNIPSQQQYSFSLPYTYPGAGMYSFELSCDMPLPDGTVAETNENNNTATYSLQVMECKPNLTLQGCESFDVQPADPAYPGAVTLLATIHNNGNAAAVAPVEVRFSLSGGAVYTTVYNNNLAPGQSAVVTVNAASVPPATQTLTATVDHNNTIDELNETDNSITGNMCWDFAPMPYCTPFTNFWDFTYHINQVIPLHVGVQQYHLYDASALKVRFLVSGPGISGTVNLGDALLTNVQQVCGCPLSAVLPSSFVFSQVGVYTFTMITDPDNVYTECDETNNALAVNVTVSNLPDMRILSQHIAPSKLNPEPGEPITMNISYENIGQSNINDQMKLKVLVDEIPVDFIYPVTGLITGGTATYTIPSSWSSNLVGVHVIRAIIDADNEVAETDEMNNEATRTIVVGAAANMYFQLFAADNTLPDLNDAITIHARIGNNGDLDVEGDVVFSYVNNMLDTIAIGTIHIAVPNNDSISVQMPWIVADPSTVLVGKIINASVLEFNYDDNMATAIIGGQSCITWTDAPPANPPLNTAVNYLCSQNIIINTQSAVNNQNAIKRHDLAKIVFLGLLGANAVTPADHFTSVFFDLQDTGVYYYQPAKALSFLDYGDGISPFSRDFACFRPANNILRKDAMKVFAEAWNLPRNFSGPSPFSDVTVTDPMYPWIKTMYDHGLITGVNGAFSPDQELSRNDAFVVLYKMLTMLSKPTPQESDYFHPYNVSTKLSRVPGIDEGNFNSYAKTSFSVDGLMPLEFTHGYNAASTEMPEEYFRRSTMFSGVVYDQYSLSKGWSHSYNAYITSVKDDSTNESRVMVHWGSGVLDFYKAIPGTPVTYVAESPGNYDMLSTSNGQFVLTKKKQTTYIFQPLIVGNQSFIAPLVKIKDRNNNELSLSYDTLGYAPRLQTVTDPSGRILQFGYDNNSFPYRVTSVTATTGSIIRSISFGYNTFGQLVSYADPKGQLTAYAYDNNPVNLDLLTQIILPKGNVINNTYQNRRLNSSKMNNTMEVVVSGNINYQNGTATTTGNTAITRNGTTMNYTTQRNNNASVTALSGSGIDVAAQYSDATNPTLPTFFANLLANITGGMSYDSKGNLLSSTKSSNSQTITETYTYNTLNDITSHTDGRSNTTYFGYTNGNLTSIQQPAGATNISYNANGTVTSVINPSGITTDYGYNSYGNATSATIANIITSSAVYDDAGRMISSTYPNNVTTTFSYDANDNRLNDHLDPSGLSINTIYAFDPNDNLSSVTNALNDITSLTYDNQDELIQQSFGGQNKHFEYNEDGTLKKFTSQNNVAFNYTYDTDGQLTNDGYATYTYNTDKTLNTITANGKALSYGYDGFKRITSVSYSDFNGNTVTYQYDNNSNITQINYPDNAFVAKYDYDANNRLTAVKDVSNNVLCSYTYFNDGRLQQQTNSNGTVTKYFYDAAGRMDSIATLNGSNVVIAAYGFTLDNNGNHTQERMNVPNQLNMPSLAALQASGSYSFNRVQQYNSNSFTHDNNGNHLTEGSQFAYTWDTKDNLIAYTNSGNITAYEYDGMEARRKKNNTRFVSDPLNNNNVLMETDNAGNPIAIYVHGLGLVCRITPGSGAKHFYHYDYRGSTVAITDGSQNVTHRYLYGAFGEDFGAQETGFTNSFRYVGKYGVMYEDSALYFMRARYYSPDLGRFLGEDPVWGTNLMAYCGNNPVGFIDPSGLQPDYGAGYNNSEITDFTSIFNSIDNGTLCINSSEASPSLSTNGHAWVSYTDNFGNTTTFGTWGNDGGKGIDNLIIFDGLRKDKEKGYQYKAAYCLKINNDQARDLFSYVAKQKIWSLTKNCSDFASILFHRVTGVNISSGIIPNPSQLGFNINKLPSK